MTTDPQPNARPAHPPVGSDRASAHCLAIARSISGYTNPYRMGLIGIPALPPTCTARHVPAGIGDPAYGLIQRVSRKPHGVPAGSLPLIDRSTARTKPHTLRPQKYDRINLRGVHLVPLDPPAPDGRANGRHFG